MKKVVLCALALLGSLLWHCGEDYHLASLVGTEWTSPDENGAVYLHFFSESHVIATETDINTENVAYTWTDTVTYSYNDVEAKGVVYLSESESFNFTVNTEKLITSRNRTYTRK